MSLTKRNLENAEENLKLAKEILIEIGTIKVCDVCGYYTANEMLNGEVYAMATSKYKEVIKDEKYDFDLFHKCIKEIYEESGVESIAAHMEEVHLKD